MTEQTTHFGTNYRSLNDIRLRKAQLRTDLTKDSNKIAGGVKKKTRREDKGLVDEISATIILQDYMRSKGL